MKMYGLSRKTLDYTKCLNCPVLVGGDFNLPLQIVNDLSDLLTSFDMVQHVPGATHRAGNTLDLIVGP